MNTSRDIEKLFDHFGGNAGDYQEIGRENEAKTARTRWPLLATLDFAQPTIPEIAPRREVQLNSAQSRASDASGGAASPATPILRGRQPLFTRPHRRTIPPVNPPAAESLSALRFSVLGESASKESETIPDSAFVAAAAMPAATPAPVETRPVTNDSGVARQAQSGPVRPAATFGSGFLARRVSEAAPAATQAIAQTQPQSQSILGKLFKPQQVPAAASAPADSLDSVFERLRHAGQQTAESTNTHAGAGYTTRASRLARS
ncbi:hypothetical protein AWB79_02475 [Caballeronia hypogeia]|uniref:Cellulose biosynthesis protein BcsR n=1 Tax=Caballeronia hypogeia TaxID=1777140 RepID=A0A158AJP4_9BURK|nr:cellulose biosynthesis protein BcsP [Caballeronia hypogeia]SAK58000.1 hypothetical protein AWB79_02475 [Caballeronia hypogeia]